MKKIVSLLLIVFVLTFLVGCSNKEDVKLKVNCEQESIEETYKVGDVISCTLLGDDYDLTVKKITNNKVKFVASRDGLVEPNEDGTINLTRKNKNFILNKGDKLELVLQITDASGMIEIEWNE